MSSSDQLPAVRVPGGKLSSDRSSDPTVDPALAPRRAVRMLWRVFAANAAVFALAFALLALTPVTIHARIRLAELVILLVGLVVMLVVDLILLREALNPLARLRQVMGTIDMLRPGQRALGFERSSTEVLALAEAFNEMLARLEDERRDSSARVLAAQEQERLRIARELHDEIGQTLIAAALRAEHASSRANLDRQELSQLAEIVQHTLGDLRRISRELRPEALEELGLTNALITLCERVAHQSGLRVQRELEGSLPPMAPEVELAIYRVAQEALTNAVKHAHASQAKVSLTRSDGELLLKVADDGRGFPSTCSKGGGLAGMRERALLIGADLGVESHPGAGVVVTLRLPLAGR